MLQMYYLRTHVFPKQEKEFVETAMAFACDIHEFSITANLSTPRAVLTSRSILSTSKRNKCRKLLPTSAGKSSGKAELQSKRWSRQRRRKLTLVDHHRRSSKLLYKLQHQQYNRPARSRNSSDVSYADEPVEERQSTGNVVPGDREFTSSLVRSLEQNTSPSISTNGLCSSATSTNKQRRTSSYRMSSLALVRSLRLQRDQTHPQMSQRKRPNLRVLQSRSLESLMLNR